MLSKVLTGREASQAARAEFAPARPAAATTSRALPAGSGSGPESAELRSTVQRLEAELGAARKQAFEAGRAEGEQRTRAELDPVLARMNAAIGELAGMRAEMRRRAERDVVQLSLLIARRVLHRELNVDANAIAALARVALDRLSRSESYKVIVHPRFANAVTAALPANLAGRVRVEADAAREPGSLLIESPDGVIDASIETQLDEIGRGLADRLDRA